MIWGSGNMELGLSSVFSHGKWTGDSGVGARYVLRSFAKTHPKYFWIMPVQGYLAHEKTPPP